MNKESHFQTLNIKTRGRSWPIFIWVLLVVAIVILWAAIVLNPAWLETSPLERGSVQEVLVHLSHFGSSFGGIAALFAGIAAILLAFNLRLQQHELAAMRREMDRDRCLQELIFLIQEYDLAKRHATHMFSRLNPLGADGAFAERVEMPGHRYIFKEAKNYLEKRIRGDYEPPHDIGEFRAANTDPDDPGPIRNYNPLFPFLTSAKQIAKFLSRQSPSDRARFLPLFESSATVFDLIVLHEHILISGDRDFQSYAEEASIFAKLKLEMPAFLDGGPTLSDSAYESTLRVVAT